MHPRRCSDWLPTKFRCLIPSTRPLKNVKKWTHLNFILVSCNWKAKTSWNFISCRPNFLAVLTCHFLFGSPYSVFESWHDHRRSFQRNIDASALPEEVAQIAHLTFPITIKKCVYVILTLSEKNMRNCAYSDDSVWYRMIQFSLCQQFLHYIARLFMILVKYYASSPNFRYNPFPFLQFCYNNQCSTILCKFWTDKRKQNFYAILFQIMLKLIVFHHLSFKLSMNVNNQDSHCIILCHQKKTQFF